MTYLIPYVAIGVAVLIVTLVSHRQTTSKSDLYAAWMDAAHPERRTWRYRLVSDVVAPALAGVFMVAVWPVTLFMIARKQFSGKAERVPTPAVVEFAVKRDNLVRQTTIDEIETLERIADPMGAVPDRPFGHLNAAWLKFAGNFEPQDSIWKFSADWVAKWGRRERREGYVIVKGERIGPYFLTKAAALDDD